MARENKPKFLRRGWHKLIRLGSTVKSKRKWRGAKGRHNKIRLERRGQQARPKIGWKNMRSEKVQTVRVENIRELEKVQKGSGVIIGRVGGKKKKELTDKANEMGLKILNKYKENKNAVKK